MKKLSKRFLSLFLALLMLCSVMPAGTMTAQAANGVSNKINSLRSVYQHGLYWNHAIKSAGDKEANNNYGIGQNGPHGGASIKNPNAFITNRPCNHHGFDPPIDKNGNSFDCNCFDGAVQCWGFANRFFWDVFGIMPSNVDKRWDKGNVSIGDQVRFWTEANNGHSAIVIGKSGNTITVVECNAGSLSDSSKCCKITWGGQYTINDILWFKHAQNYNQVNSTGNTDSATAIFYQYNSSNKQKSSNGIVKIHYDGFANGIIGKFAYGTISFSDKCYYKLTHKGAPKKYCNFDGVKLLYFALTKNGEMYLTKTKPSHGSDVSMDVRAKVHLKSGTNFSSPHNIEKIDTLFYRSEGYTGKYINKYKDGDNRVYFKYAGGAINGTVNYTGASTVVPYLDINTYNRNNSASQNKASVSLLSLTALKNLFEITANAATGSFVKTNVIIPAGSYLRISEYDGEYGKTNYNGREVWVNLNYCYYVAPAILPPPAPTVTLNSAQDICDGDFIEFSWNSVRDAESYVAQLYDSNGKCVKTIRDIYGTSAWFQVMDGGTYTIKVYGKNYMFDGDVGTCSKKVTVHPPSKVTFQNDDGSVIAEQMVSYNKNATAPMAPERRGYSFRSWKGNLNNIKAETTVTAEYEKSKYRVQFVDSKGSVISEQSVLYGEDATPPEASSVPVPNSNYEFAGWDSEKYKNVYQIDKSEPIKIKAVYNWINKDLPIACSNARAERQPDGYTVYFELENYADNDDNTDLRTRGRAVVALKTQSGKLVYTTESAAFSIAEGGTKAMEVFVPCEVASTVAEVMIVDSSYDGIPISNIESSSIDNALMWSNWLTELPDYVDENDAEIEERTEYRYRDITKTTGNTSKKPDYVTILSDGIILHNDEYQARLADTNYTYLPKASNAKRTDSSGNWSSWSWSKIDGFDYEDKTRTVQTQQAVKSRTTNYNYYYYRYWNTTYGTWYYTYGSGMGGTYYSYSQTSPLTYYATYDGINAYVRSGNPVNFGGELWFSKGTTTTEQKATQWRYRDTTHTYYFYRWDDEKWSKWAPEVVNASDEREVETRTTKRYKSVSAGIEDNSGESHTFEGQVEEELAGKNITLFITKYKASSDFTNEFVGQSKIRDDGSYSFTYKLREEPSADTGDFTIKIGIEGESGTREVGVIEAPKPKYTVTFYDNDDNAIDTQTVTEGENAEMPNGPEVAGKTFICWNNSCTNVHSNLEVKPVYTDNIYTVAFVDWRTQDITLKEYKYGDPLEAPAFDDCESGKALDWDVVLDNEGEEVLVTSNMVVQAVYDTNEYTVDFVDAYGEVVDSRTVEYGDSITVEEMPDLPEDENAEYYDWAVEPEELMNIKEDIIVPAVFDFDETTATPTANVTTGHYDNTQTVTLSCEDENATIFYTTDGSDPKETQSIVADNNNEQSPEQEGTDENIEIINDDIEIPDDAVNGNAIESSNVRIYTEPIEISADTELRFYASSLGKNDSEEADEYYAFGNSKIVNVFSEFSDDSDYEDYVTFISNDMSTIDNEMFALNGYTLGGVYTDSEYNNLADFENGTFGNVVNLYAKYTINSYTVTFKKDGETVDTQTVNYGGEATPPEMPKDGTKVFYEWDTNEYTFVDKDLTVNAVYKEESEITTIKLNRDNYVMDEGDTFKLEGEINGTDLPDDISIIWHSDDESIATVYDDGTVTATGSGETTIFAVTSDDSAVAECKITVNPSVNYSVTLKDSAKVRFDSAGYLRNIPFSDNTVDNITANFKNSPSSLVFKNAAGEAISGNTLVGTGTTISLMNNGTAIHSITAVMTGDVTCDGKINNRDVVYAARVIVKKQTANDPQLLAMDANGDGKVNNRDVAMLARYLVGKETIA